MGKITRYEGFDVIRADIQRFQSRQGESGFSLIELAIIMVIVGLLVASSLSTFDAYQKRTALNSTLEKRNNIEIALGRFVAENGRLPCPANPALAITEAASGIENCRPQNLAYPTLSAVSCIGHCRIEGARHGFTGENGVPEVPGTQGDRILRGVVPYKTLGLALWEAYDGWGTMMTYAVTEVLASSYLVTNVNPPPWGKILMQREKYGAIDLAVWDNVTETDISAPNPEAPGKISKSWAFVLLSHGPDTRGGWTVNGAQAVPCTGQGRDLVNCDAQSKVFIEPSYIVNVKGDRFYDDAMLTTSYVTSADKWYYSMAGAIRNKEGKLGIDIEDPQESLDVLGSTRVDAARSNQFCNVDGSMCFEAGIIGGAGLNCGAGGLMRGIEENHQLCANEIALGSISPGVCPGGTFLVGFCADGSMLCRSPLGAEPVCP